MREPFSTAGLVAISVTSTITFTGTPTGAPAEFWFPNFPPQDYYGPCSVTAPPIGSAPDRRL